MGNSNSGRRKSSDAPQPLEGETTAQFWRRTIEPTAYAHHVLLLAWIKRGNARPMIDLAAANEGPIDGKVIEYVNALTRERNTWCSQDVAVAKLAMSRTQAQRTGRRGRTVHAGDQHRSRAHRDRDGVGCASLA